MLKINKEYKKYSAVILLLTLFLFFQNCDNVEFQSSLGGELVLSDDVFNPEIGAIPLPAVIDEVKKDEVKKEDVKRDYVAKDKEHMAEDKKKKECNNKKHKELLASSDQHYRCNLEGPGKSRHSSLVNSNLSSETGMPRSICMTKYACESIVAKKLKVKEARFAIQCVKDIAQVVHLSDFEIETSLAGM